MYIVEKTYEGKRVSLFYPRLPKAIVLSGKLSQSTLKVLHSLGVAGVTEKNDDNKG